MSHAATDPAQVNVSRNALLSALAQSAVMISGGINAVIIGARYPVSAETDSLFTAFAIYSIVLVVATSARTALVPRLLDRDNVFGPFNAVLASLLWFIPLIVIAFVAIGIPLVGALTSGDASIGQEALVIFCPAAFLQMLIAVTAAMFATRGDFVSPAKAFALGGVVSVVTFVVLEPLVGLIAMPLAALISSLVTAALAMRWLVPHGWRPRGLRAVGVAKARPWIATMGLGSGFYVGAQALYLVSMLFATASLAVGSATVYTYAYLAIGLITALSSSAGAMALAAPVAESWAGDPRVVEPVEDDVTRSLSVVLVVAGGLIATIGGVLASPLLTGFTHADINALMQSATILTVASLGSALTIVPLAAMFAARRYGQVTAVAFVGLAAIAALTAVLLQLDESLVAVSVAASVTNILLAWGILWLCHRGATLRRIGVQVWQVGIVAIPGAAAYFVADRLLSSGDSASDLSHFAAAAAGTALVALYVAIVLPTYRGLLTRMFLQAAGRPVGQ